MEMFDLWIVILQHFLRGLYQIVTREEWGLILCIWNKFSQLWYDTVVFSNVYGSVKSWIIQKKKKKNFNIVDIIERFRKILFLFCLRSFSFLFFLLRKDTIAVFHSLWRKVNSVWSSVNKFLAIFNRYVYLLMNK